MNDGELIQVLEDAGLSPYQAEAFVTLLALGDATATDVADGCDVPDPRIYDVLRDLESKGYVETYQQDSLHARAHDPGAVLEDLRSRSERFLAAADAIEDRWSQPAVADGDVSIVKRFDTVLERARDLVDDAQRQIQMTGTVDQYRALEREFADVHDRDVDIKVCLCTDDDQSFPEPSTFDGVCTEVRQRDLPNPFLVIVDRRWSCFAPHECSVNEYGILVSDHTYTFVFHWFFLACLWEAWETVFTERSGDPPIRYVDVRRCVQDVVPLLEDGATVVVRVDGYETDSTDEAVLEGRIVDVEYPGDPVGAEGDLPLSQLAGRISLDVDTGDEVVEVGGWGATVEDVEGTTIVVTDVRYD